jgi:CxxC-x17-CxxC domain-containing protein
MASRINQKVEKMKRNEEYAKRFQKKKRVQTRRDVNPFDVSAPATFSSSAPSTAHKAFHDAVCNTCGVDTTVPFKPTGAKPVLCRPCFQKAA